MPPRSLVFHDRQDQDPLQLGYNPTRHTSYLFHSSDGNHSWIEIFGTQGQAQKDICYNGFRPQSLGLLPNALNQVAEELHAHST